MTETRAQEFDGPWKGALEVGFDLFLDFFLFKLYAIVDWTKDHEALDQELQKLMPQSTAGVRRVDKLFKTLCKDTGDPRYFHVEAQAQPEDFSARMFQYSYRGRELFRQPLISIAILSDDQANWHPQEHFEGELGSETLFTFLTVKVLQWAERQGELEASVNVFALFVSAHLETLKTRDHPDARAAGKLRLLKNLANREMSDLDRGQWYHLIDWILPLPAERERQVFQELQGEKNVTFITYAERVGMEKGMEKGIEQGQRTAFLQMLRGSLKAKFGDEGEALAAQLPEQTPLARLAELVPLVAVATTLEELQPQFTQT